MPRNPLPSLKSGCSTPIHCQAEGSLPAEHPEIKFVRSKTFWWSDLQVKGKSPERFSPEGLHSHFQLGILPKGAVRGDCLGGKRSSTPHGAKAGQRGREIRSPQNSPRSQQDLQHEAGGATHGKKKRIELVY